MGVFDATGFTDDGHANLPGVLEFIFDLGADVVGEDHGVVVGDLGGVDDDTQITAGLDGIGLDNPLERGSELFEFIDSVDVKMRVFGAGTGTCAGNGVGN